jgi:hypothetical protein
VSLSASSKCTQQRRREMVQSQRVTVHGGVEGAVEEAEEWK